MDTTTNEISTTAVPLIPDTAPFSAEQRAWLNGYLVGLLTNAHTAPARSASPGQAATPAKPLVILFGSQTGTAELLAKRISREAKGKNFETRVMEMSSFQKIDWAREERVLL